MNTVLVLVSILYGSTIELYAPKFVGYTRQSTVEIDSFTYRTPCAPNGEPLNPSS